MLPQGIYPKRRTSIFTSLFNLSSSERERERKRLPVGNLLINYLHICHTTKYFEIAIFDCTKRTNYFI